MGSNEKKRVGEKKEGGTEITKRKKNHWPILIANGAGLFFFNSAIHIVDRVHVMCEWMGEQRVSSG